MFRTCGHSLKLAQILCWGANVKILNMPDLQKISGIQKGRTTPLPNLDNKV